MRIYRTGGHTKYDMKVHLIFCPKYRKRVLYGKISLRLREIIKIQCSKIDVKIITGKLAYDHIHLFVSYPVKKSVSEIVRVIKGGSSHKIMKENPWIRKKYYWGGHFWARGYMAVSSGNITDEMIENYIDEQDGESIQGDIELI